MVASDFYMRRQPGAVVTFWMENQTTLIYEEAVLRMMPNIGKVSHSASVSNVHISKRLANQNVAHFTPPTRSSRRSATFARVQPLRTPFKTLPLLYILYIHCTANRRYAMRPGGALRWLRGRPGTSAFLFFFLVYLALIRYCSQAYYRDPTSVFFDPVRGYEPRYSAERQIDADAFIRNANLTTYVQITPQDPKMCIGIATVAREQDQYVRRTVGSLIEDLEPWEREQIFLVILIAHADPQMHPIYGEPWLTNVADKTLLYDVNQGRLQNLRDWETNKDYRKKAIFDYTYVLQRCVDAGTQWITMIEDDTLAVDGWFPRAMEALQKADEQHSSTEEMDWLYLRLFYTEEFLGWNTEEWPRYFAASVAVIGMTGMALFLIRQFIFENTITNNVIAITCFVCAPAFISLYFMAGRLSMQPSLPGLYQMPEFGCCAQGLVYSHNMASKVITRLSQVREGYVDQIVEAWANEANLVRWVTIPSLLQHVGALSSKGDDRGSAARYGRSVAEKIWSFSFEEYGVDNTSYSTAYTDS